MKDVNKFLTDVGWNFLLIQNRVPNYVVGHIRNNMSTPKLHDEGDTRWQTLTSYVSFTVKSAWEHTRKKGKVDEDLSHLWFSGLTFEILPSFEDVARKIFYFSSYKFLES